MDEPAVVQVSRVSKRFMSPDGQWVDALKDITLEIPAGKFTTLLGPSGCGKTTLLRMIGGFEEPSLGGIFIEDELMEGVPANKRPTNTVFQHYGLFPHMTVGQNVAYGLEVAGLDKEEVRQRVADALAMVRLPDMESRKITQISGGQQQRVALARAIVMRPKVLLLDEPMAALDRQLRKEMQVELKRLQNELGIAFLCVTHDQEEALSMSDLVVVMNNGQIEQKASPKEIYERPQTRFVAGFVGETNLFDGLVTTDEAGHATLTTVGGNRLALGEACCQGTLCVSLRPEKLLPVTADSSLPRLSGVVQEATYLGNLTRVRLGLAGGESLITTLAGQVPQQGEPLSLCYDPADLCLLQD